QPAPSRSCHRHGHSLPAPARLHRTGQSARAVRRTHPAQRRQVAGAGARKARLRVDQAGGGRGMNAIVVNTASALERYRTLFESRYTGRDELTALRRDALERFLAAGFPGPRDEDWKYT